MVFSLTDLLQKNIWRTAVWFPWTFIRSQKLKLVAACSVLLLLSACGGGGDGGPAGTTSTTTITGSAGDGPITGGIISATDGNGKAVVTTPTTPHTDSTAHYSFTILSSTTLPLTVTITGGTDNVTGVKQDFDLTGVDIAPLPAGATITLNINPISTLVVASARAKSGLNATKLNATNLSAATTHVLNTIGFGLPSVFNPMTTQVTPNNVATMIKSNEAVAELIRRTSESTGKTFANTITAIAEDLTDGVIDGASSGTSTQTTAKTAGVILTRQAEIAAGLLAGKLKITDKNGGTLVTAASSTAKLNAAIQMTQPTATGTNADVSQVPVTQAAIDQANNAIALANILTGGNDPSLNNLSAAINTLNTGTVPGNTQIADISAALTNASTSLAMANTNANAGTNTTMIGTAATTTNSAPTYTGTPAISGTAAAGNTLSLTGTATSDANGDTVTLSYQWFADGTLIAGATGATYVVQSADAGKKITVVITADDGKVAANSAHSVITAGMTVSAAPAQPVITTTTTATNDTTPTLSGTAEAGSTVKLFDTDGTTVLGTATANSAGIWSITASTLGTGVHTLTVKVTDAAGNVSMASTGLGLTVDTTAPTNQNAVLASPVTVAGGGSVTIASSGTASNSVWLAPAGTTTFSAGATMTRAASGTATTIIAPATGGAYKLFVIDAVGNASAASTATVTVDTVAPTVSSNHPLNNATAVAVSAAIDATFSEPVAGVTTTSFTVTPTGGSALTGTTVNHNSSNIESLSHPNLQANTTYTVTLTTAITDVAGNALTATGGQSLSWSFTTAPPPVVVTALYPTNGTNWNDYVKNDGSNVYSATDAACTGTETGGYSACIHGGEKRAVTVTGKTVCTNLTATDALGAFDWTCKVINGTATMISTGLKSTRNLSDLVNFTTPGWLANSVTVKESATTLFTTASTAWWGNTVKLAVANTSLEASGTTAAGTVYLIASNLATDFTIGANKVAVVIKPAVTITGAGNANGNVIQAVTKNFLWLEGKIDATGDKRGVLFAPAKFSVLRNLSALNAGSEGIDLAGSSNNNSLLNITASNNGSRGVALDSSSNNSLSNLMVSNNSYYGIYLNTSSNNNSLSNLTVANNGFLDGIVLDGNSNNNILSNLTVVNNKTYGVYIAGSSNNILSNITASNNGSDGVFLSVATGNASIFSNNNSISNLTSSNNGGSGVNLNTSSNNYFTGLLRLGNNTTADCSVSGGTSPGLNNLYCSTNGNSDSTLTRSVTLASSFVGKITTNDVANQSDTTGTATFPLTPSTFDWSSFDNSYRAWGQDGGAFPTSTNRGRWTAGTGQIWDWSLVNFSPSTITGVWNVLALKSGGTAANSITHTWVGTAANQAACTALVAGSTFNATNNVCQSTYLRNASEINGDGIGNDNGLCESNETCLYTPNIGSYQGHGPLISAGTFTDGAAITGVTLMKYTTNGY